MYVKATPIKKVIATDVKNIILEFCNDSPYHLTFATVSICSLVRGFSFNTALVSSFHRPFRVIMNFL